MNGQLAIGTVIIVVMAMFHAAGLLAVFHILQWIEARSETWHESVRIVMLLGTAVLMIVAIHTTELWGWAGVYYLLGEFDRFENALYFSAVTATTLGYGDITLSPEWRLLSSFEGMGGLILFGTSTAFLLSLTQRVFSIHYVKVRKHD